MGRDRTRLAGVLLLAWGILGTVLVVLGMTAGLDLASRAETLITSSDRALAAASQATRLAAQALDGVQAGIGQAQASSMRAAGLADAASDTLGELSSSMSLSVLGTQPLLPLAQDFSDSADDAAALSDELESLAETLVTTGTDTQRLSDELRNLADALDEQDRSASPPPLRLLVVGVLAWVALPTAAALVVGAVLAAGRRIG